MIISKKPRKEGGNQKNQDKMKAQMKMLEINLNISITAILKGD